MSGATERRERAARNHAAHYAEHLQYAREEGFLAGCDWQHKTTLAYVAAWLRATGNDAGHGVAGEAAYIDHNQVRRGALADAIERGEAEGATT